MTRFLKLAVSAAVLGIGSLNTLQAATNVAANIFLNVNFSLTGVKQGDSGIVPVRIANKDIISAIGVDKTNTFSSKAKLLLKIPVGLDSGPTFVVRDLTPNALDFEVPSTMMWFIQIGDSVDSSRTSSTGVTTGSQATIFEFTFQSGQLSFDVQGYTTSALDNRGNAKDTLVDLCPTTVSSKVTGTGSDANGASIVLQGTITANGRKVVSAN